MKDIQTTRHIDDFLIQAENLHLKLWAIIGNDPAKTEKVVSYLNKQDWQVIDVGKEVIKLPGVNMTNDDPIIEIGEIIKDLEIQQLEGFITSRIEAINFVKERYITGK